MKRYLLPIIIFLAFILRVAWIERYPVGFTPDEASLGYDAYSILKTGKDQWGHSFPLILESFGDFKSPLYAYLTIPSVFLFGLTKFATRLPNALIGTAAVYVTYLLASELSVVVGKKKLAINNQPLAIIASFLLAISPWHIMMSRGAFEANLTTFFLPLGIFLFLRSLQNSKLLPLSGLVFGLNLFSYHAAKLVTPLIVIILIVSFREKLSQIGKKMLFNSGVIFAIFILLTAYSFFLGAGLRAKDINIFKGSLEEAATIRNELILKGENPAVARLLHNKYQVAFKRFVYHWTEYYTFRFLFKDGPAEFTYGMLPGNGVLYWFELPLLLGFFIAFVRKKNKFPYLFLTFWLAIAPIPAALASGPGYAANRAVVMLPAVQIALALGAFEVYDIFRERFHGRRLLRIGLATYILLSFILAFSFFEKYFYLSKDKAAKGMLYGNLEAAYWLKQNVNAQDIIVSRKLSEPQIYVAFANKWDPRDYQKATLSWDYKKQGLGWVDQMHEYKLGNYTFGGIEWDKNGEKNAYLVGRPDEFPETASPVVIFKYPSSEPAIFVVNPSLTKYAYSIN